MGGITQKQLADQLGVGRTTISFIENGRSKPTFDLIHALYAKLGVNPHFVITGSGKELITYHFKPKGISLDADTAMEKFGIGALKATLLITAKAQAGYYKGHVHDDLPQVVIPGVDNPNARVFEVTGDSMLPIIHDGDFLACSQVKRNDFRDGGLYVIVTQNDGITVKYARESAEGLRCYPENTSEFSPFIVPHEEVLELWDVKVRVTKQVTGSRLEGIPMTPNLRSDQLEKVVEKLLEMPQFNKNKPV